MDQLAIFSPFLVLTTAALGVLVLIAFKMKPSGVYALTLAGFYIALASVGFLAPHMGRSSANFLVLDRAALFSMTLIIAAGAFSAICLKRAVKNNLQTEEGFFFLLVATLGGSILVATDHFVVLLLGLKLLSLPFYVLLAHKREDALRTQAAMEIFIIGEVFFAVLLFGVALIYFKMGTLQISKAFLDFSLPSNSTGLVLAVTAIALVYWMLKKMQWRRWRRV